jgi:hypothetical protein
MAFGANRLAAFTTFQPREQAVGSSSIYAAIVAEKSAVYAS